MSKNPSYCLADDLDYKSYRDRLANCALVRHAWRSIVQPWMFIEITIRPDWMNNTAKFFGASSSSHHLSKHIKSIRVIARDITTSLSAMLGTMNEREMFRLFKNVEHIYIPAVSHGDHQNLSADDITLISQFRQLRKMQLKCVRVASFHDVLSSFPALTHLELYRVTFSDSGPAHVRALKLQRLAILLSDVLGYLHPRMSLDAPELEYLTLMWRQDWNMDLQEVESAARNVLKAIPLENIKTLNLCRASWQGGDIILGTS